MGDVAGRAGQAPPSVGDSSHNCHGEHLDSRSQVRACRGGDRVPHERDGESSPPVPVKVTFFGNGVFADVMKLPVKLRSYCGRVDP